jgi:hypothetical protein
MTTIRHTSDHGGTEDLDIAARAKVRGELLTDGLLDYVDLNAVDWNVRQQMPSAPASEVQKEALGIIRSLVSEGLFVLGAMSGPRRSWEAWDDPLESAMRRISEVYVAEYDDPPAWIWFSWMKLTDKGRHVAEALSADP